MVVLAVGIVAGNLLSWLCMSITYQLVGSAVTLAGFMFAYLRASHRGDTVPEQFKQFGNRLIGKGTPEHHTASAHSSITLRPGASVGLAPLENLEGRPLREQVDLIAAYIRDRINERTTDLYVKLGALQLQLADTQASVDERTQETFQKLLEQVQDLRTDLDRKQVLDLRTAMFGIYLIGIGVAFTYLA